MIVTHCQRWYRQLDSYRPAGEVFDVTAHDAAEISGKGSDNLCKSFIVEHHYSASYVAARRRFGLYRGDRLVGVAVFSMPWQRSLTRARMPFDNSETVELSRFVLLDEVAANGESWFLARCFHALRDEGFSGVLSYSDPQSRTNAHGDTVFAGHLGIIYQASNATYVGHASSRTLHIFSDGSVFSERDMSKIRRGERGQAYSIQILVDRGAKRPGAGANMKAWLSEWRSHLCRPLRHPGNHTYLWALKKSGRRHLPVSAAYPKHSQLELSLAA